MLKQKLLRSSLLLMLLLLTACGGGGSGGSGDVTVNSGPATTVKNTYTKAILKVDLVGTLPAGSAISGVSFALFLKPSLIPATTDGAVAAGVVTPSGTFANGSQLGPDWVPADSVSTSGKMLVTLSNSSPAGVTQVGEVARITLKLANQEAPPAGSYYLAPFGVTDLNGNPIPALQAVITDVILQ